MKFKSFYIYLHSCRSTQLKKKINSTNTKLNSWIILSSYPCVKSVIRLIPNFAIFLLPISSIKNYYTSHFSYFLLVNNFNNWYNLCSVTDRIYVHWSVSMLLKNINHVPYDLLQKKQPINTPLWTMSKQNVWTMFTINFLFLHAFWLCLSFHHPLLQEEDRFRIVNHVVQGCFCNVMTLFHIA
jgi:hypothetical protein